MAHKGFTYDWNWKQKSLDLLERYEANPDHPFTPKQLDQIATGLLLRARKDDGGAVYEEGPKWLNPDQEHQLHRREIYAAEGSPVFLDAPDSSAGSKSKGDGQRIFNRTHPEGRKVNPEASREKNGAAFYR